MNTLQYFLSTLRPAPPPSPRPSTSALPLPSLDALSEGTGVSPLDVPLPGEADDFIEDEDDGGGERPLARRSSTGGSRKGKGRERPRQDDAGGGGGAEDPLRDGASIRTELERGEGVEPAFVSHSRTSSAGLHLPTPPPSPSLLLSPPQPPPPPLPALEPDPTPSSLEKASLAPSSSSSPTTPSSARAWPSLSRLLHHLITALPYPLRIITAPVGAVFSLVRRFLSLFGLVSDGGGGRPGYNALLAPTSATAAAPSALSTEPHDPEKGGGGGGTSIRTVSLTLTHSTSSTSTSTSSHPPSPSLSGPIPRPIAPPRLTPKTLVLDLDETLIHSTSRPYRGSRAGKGLKSRVVEVVIDGRSTVYTVYKRPWVDFFLRKVSSWYTVIIFTASLPEYADPVIDWLDGGDGRGGMVGGRLFRAHCLPRNGSYVKDLAVIPDTDLSRVCLVDNSPASYAINQANGIPIEGWINDPSDECLLDLLPMLDSLRFCGDVRRVLGLRGFGRACGGGGSMGGGAGGLGGGAMGGRAGTGMTRTGAGEKGVSRKG